MPHAGGNRTGVKRSIFESAGGFDENLLGGEDVDFCWRVQLAGIPLRLVHNATVRYRYRESLSGIFRQAHLSGRSDALLYRRYRAAGMSGHSIGVGLKEWLRLMRRLPRIHGKSDWARWVRRLGQCVGRLEGSLRYRVIYL